MPYNAVSQRPYSGLNVLLLWGQYSSNGWVTYKQAKDLGGNVRKGERGTRIIFWKMMRKEKDNGKVETFPLLKTYTVFNVEQCDGLTVKPLAPAEPLPEVDTITARVSAMVDLRVSASDRACYIPSVDRIEMPRANQFKSTEGYTSTLLHEATHATGHKSRLNRELNTYFGGESYAAEELIAEMGSAFLCAAIGHDFNPQHSSYIQSWLRVLKGDDKAIFKAASQAQKAADYVKGYILPSAEEADHEQAAA